jgi:hypothetical protein
MRRCARANSAVFGICADILTFLSICLLAAPAFHINHYALRAARLSKIRFRPGFSKLDQVYRGGLGFSHRGVSGNLPVQYSNRRTEIHEETKT